MKLIWVPETSGKDWQILYVLDDTSNPEYQTLKSSENRRVEINRVWFPEKKIFKAFHADEGK